MYNGIGFHQQKFTAVAMSPTEFDTWVQQVRATGVPLDARALTAISRRDTRARLIADLLPGASQEDKVYLTGVTPEFFQEVVRATMNGSPVALAPASQVTEKSPVIAPSGSAAPTEPKQP